MHSDQSESDEDIPPMKEISNFVSSDSDLESYDVSSRRGREPASGRLFMRIGTSPKMTSSFPKIIQRPKELWMTFKSNESYSWKACFFAYITAFQIIEKMTIDFIWDYQT